MCRDAWLGDKSIKKIKTLITVRIRIMVAFGGGWEIVLRRGHAGGSKALAMFYF